MDVFNSIIDWCGTQFSNFASWVLLLLPDSPFKLLDNSPIKEYLPILNWIFPFSFMVSSTVLWLSAIAIYYAYSAILRLIKAVK